MGSVNSWINSIGSNDGDNKNNDTFDTTKYMQRIDNLLFIGRAEHDDLYDIVCGEYPNHDINHLLIDYYHFVQNLDKDKVYINDENNECPIGECKHLKRAYRDKNSFKLDHQRHTAKTLIIQQILEQIHIIKHHLIHLGMRYIENGNDEQPQILMMRKELLIKREKFEKITNRKQSKFVTYILEKETEEKYDDENNKESMVEYGFGFRFFYHSYYKNKQIKQEQIPGAIKGLIDYGNAAINSSYTFKEWYISPTYGSMKEEVLVKYLCIEQFNHEAEKAALKLSAYKHSIKGSPKRFEIIYSMKEGTVITIKHILSLMLCINFSNLSYEFSTSFRKIKQRESDESVRRRHAKFYHFAKYLRETVECFGTTFDETKQSSFFHGISQKMSFSGFQTKFYGPTSMTTQYAVAIRFATNNGIVIRIKNGGYSTNSFFDCRIWGDFPAESETLFLGGLYDLEFDGLTEISTAINYDEWIRAMRIFHTGFIKGMTSSDRILQHDKYLIHGLTDEIVYKKKKKK
eukprot:70527_1